ncbi:hypothetical protein TWF730_001505 [Orbilia blumenaviensis]|uniref:Uncharacterized protein n=1 Tax=Orbilia blumenaviensis TaxID=1796055 RepID=A0AAV9UHU3_9PEZI
MSSFIHRILRKRNFGKNKIGKTTDPPPPPVVDDAAIIPPAAPAAPHGRRSFDSRASGSIISIARSADIIDDSDDYKPWKKRRNKGKRANRGTSETLTDQMRRDFVALQRKIDRIEAHVVPKNPPEAFSIDDQSSAVTNNDLRTFIECAVAIYEEGKEPGTPKDSIPETPDEIRNAFINAMERCKDPEFLYRLSQKLRRKGRSSNTTDTGPSSPMHEDIRSNPSSEPSPKPQQNMHLPQIEYGVRYETSACESGAVNFRSPPHPTPAPRPQLLLELTPETKPDPIPGQLVPVVTHLLRNQVNSDKRQKGELMPHLPMPFGPLPSAIGESDRVTREPKYLGLHELYAQNCIERLTDQADQMAQLPRIYTENVAMEPTGIRPQIEATVSGPVALTKPTEPSFKSCPEDLSIEEVLLDQEALTVSKRSTTPSHRSIMEKPSDDSDIPQNFSGDLVVFPVGLGGVDLEETPDVDEQSYSQLGLSIRSRSQTPQRTDECLIPENIQEPEPEEEQVKTQIPDTAATHIRDDACDTTISSAYSSSSFDNDKESEDDSEREESDEDEAQVNAIHLLILLKVLAKRHNGSRDSSQSTSTSSRSQTPSDSSGESSTSSSSSVTGQTISISSSGESSPSGGSQNGSSNKRKRETGGDGDGNNSNGPPPPKKFALDVMRDVLRRFACPFARGDPAKYPGCQMINRQNLSGLKEHVKRKHFQDVLPHGIRIARNWDEVFLYCNPGWTGPMPSPYIADMFITANDNQPFSFEPSTTDPLLNDGRYRPIVPFPSQAPTPALGGDADGPGLLSQPLVQSHSHIGNYNARPKDPEPTIGQEMIEFVTTDEFRDIMPMLPPQLRSFEPSEFEAANLERYMQSNLGIDINQTRSQLMSSEFTDILNSLFQPSELQAMQEEQEEAHGQEPVLSSPSIAPEDTRVPSTADWTPSSPPPTIKLHIENPSHSNAAAEPSPIALPENAKDQNTNVVSSELSQCLDYLFADSKPYLKTQRPGSRLSTSSSSSSSLPSSSSSSLLTQDPGTQTPDTLLSERNSLDLPPPSPKPHPTKTPPKKKKKYSLHIRHKPPGPHQCSTFSFNAENEYAELKQAFNTWMTRTFFPNDGFSWEKWELEDTDYHERISSLEALVQNLPFTWTAFRTTDAAFFLVPKR